MTITPSSPVMGNLWERTSDSEADQDEDNFGDEDNWSQNQNPPPSNSPIFFSRPLCEYPYFNLGHACSHDRFIAPNFDTELEASALTALRNIVGQPSATWSSDAQKQAVMATLRLKSDVCAIMATGSGKTMLAFIPPLIEKSRVTVVVLPLKSLASDYQRRLEKIGLNYELYTSAKDGHLHGSSNLVLVSADMAKTTHWQKALGELNIRKPVVRLIFDEAHLAITANDFRTCLQNMEDLRLFPMQIVLLSGTVPKPMEDELKDAFGLLDNAQVFRTSTDRPELQYIVEDAVAYTMVNLKRTQSMFQRISASFKTEDRALIFVPRIIDGERLAAMLGCPFYRGQGLKDVDRQKYYQAWITGVSTLMVCTSAFGAGNDYSHVRLVMHVGNPQEMIGFTQEISRAGRDKKLATCYVLPTGRPNKPSQSPEKPDHSGKGQIWQLLHNSDDCIRFAITNFNDGKGVFCKDSLKGTLCSRCQRKNASTGG